MASIRSRKISASIVVLLSSRACGGFATAKHVALEAREAMSANPNSVGIIYALRNGLRVFRPIWRFFLHPTADLAFGVPHEIIDNATNAPVRAMVLPLEREPPAKGAHISTWAYPPHRKMRDSEGNDILQIQPAFYDGTLQEVYLDKGPSGRLQPPYYQTNIHLHGGSSGGPVFNESGYVFGVASCSHDGAADLAFVTPIDAIFEIELEDTDLRDGKGPRNVSVAEIAKLNGIRVRSAETDRWRSTPVSAGG